MHESVDQFFRFEAGTGKHLNGEETMFMADDVLIIPAGTNHNIINTSTTDKLKLYTIYSPANHPDGTVHATKVEAMAAEEAPKPIASGAWFWLPSKLPGKTTKLPQRDLREPREVFILAFLSSSPKRSSWRRLAEAREKQVRERLRIGSFGNVPKICEASL